MLDLFLYTEDCTLNFKGRERERERKSGGGAEENLVSDVWLFTGHIYLEISFLVTRMFRPISASHKLINIEKGEENTSIMQLN